MSAAVIGANEDPHGYALVLIDGSEDLVVVELPSRKDRAAFLVEYLEHESSSRSLSRFDAVALRLNPPPPPPPPGYPPPEWMTRLEAGLRVLRLPVLVSKVEVNVGLENATRGGMR
jgi:hypothetical protein